MTQPTSKFIRCGIPDCDWGTPFSVLGEEIEECRRQYRKHCIDRHQMHPDDTDRVFWSDLQLLTFTLSPKQGNLETQTQCQLSDARVYGRSADNAECRR
jgi:hypothetical protein